MTTTDNWRATWNEEKEYEQAYYNAPHFIESNEAFYDEDGNLIEDD